MVTAVKRRCRFTLVHLSIVGIAATITSGVIGNPAFGSGWSLDAIVAERVEFNDNIDSRPTGGKKAVGSFTNLDTILSWEGHRRTASFNSSFDIRRFFGPGARPELDTFNQFHRADFSVKRKTTKFDYSASYNIQDTASSVLEDTGFVVPFDTNRLTSKISAKATHDVNSRLQLSFSGSATQVDYERSGPFLTPYHDINLNGSLISKLTKRTTGTLSIEAGFHNADDVFNTRRNTYRFSGQLTTELSPRLSADIKAGLIAVEASLDATATTPAFSGGSTGNFFDIGLNYQLKTTNLSLTASSDITPDTFGRLQRRRSLGFDIAHQINHRSNIGFSVDVNSIEGILGQTRDSLFLSPTYSYRLTEKLNANFGYIYRHQEALGIASHSNMVYFSLSRAFSLLP
jgi:hypothetical protein